MVRNNADFCFEYNVHRENIVGYRFNGTFLTNERYLKSKVVTHSSIFLFLREQKAVNPHSIGEDFLFDKAAFSQCLSVQKFF